MKKINRENGPVFTQWGNPVLQLPTKPVPRSEISKPQFKKLVKRMFRDIEGIGVGLAANQIGLPMKLAVIEVKAHRAKKEKKGKNVSKIVPPTLIVNPKIIFYSKKKVGSWEGCLSCSGVRFWVERSASIKVIYFDETNKKVTRVIDGFEAIVFQHEIDHLYGIVCGERTAIRNGKVMPGSLVSNIWYKDHPRLVPVAARRYNKKRNI